MKSKLLLFPSLLAILISCSKRVNDPFIPEEKNQLDSIYQAPKDPFLGIPEKTSVVHVQTSIVNYNQWQNFFVSPEKMTIVMWPSHDKTLVIKDVDKAIQGIAIDKDRILKSKQIISQSLPALHFKIITRANIL